MIARILLGAVLRIAPRDFREQLGDEAVAVALERYGEARGRGRALRASMVLVREVWALLRTAVGLRVRGRGATDPADALRALRQAARSLIRRPLFAATTVGTLGLGIGSVTAIFSAVDAVLLRPLPFEDPDRIVAVFRTDVDTGERGDGMSAADAADVAREVTLLRNVAVAEPWSVDYEVDGHAESLRGWAVSEGFFEAVGVAPALGRTFTAEEFTQGADAVALLAHSTWVSRFGADPATVGRTLVLEDRAVTVVGVLPATFRFPDVAEVWLPRPPRPWDADSRAGAYLSGVARLAPGATLQDARAELRSFAESLRSAHPDSNGSATFELRLLRDELLGDVRTPLLVLFAAVSLVLLIACANVAALMLARGAQREREYAVRGALGAGARRLVGLVVAESAVLATAGSALGVAGTYAFVAVIRALAPRHLPRIDELHVDGRVLAFAIVAGVGSALVAALVPCLATVRTDLREALVEGGRSSSSVRQRRRRGLLVTAQVACAVMLVIGAGLLGRSFRVLLAQDLGFDPEGRVAVQLFRSDPGGPGHASFVDAVLEQMRAIPGVRDVAVTSEVPGATDGVVARLDIVAPLWNVDADPPPRGREPTARVNVVSAGYFELMGIDLRAGRGFAREDAGGRPVLLVNETLARRDFPAGDAIGARMRVGFGDRTVEREIVGVVRDVRALGHAMPPVPEVYLPTSQMPFRVVIFVARTDLDAASMVRPLTEAVWRADPTQAVWGAAPVASLIAAWLRERRFNLVLIAGFAAVAFVLAMVGVYGLVSSAVERRVPEIGIRRALGGREPVLLGLIVRDGMAPAAAGVALGVAGALGLSRFLRGMLYGISPVDPATFGWLSAAVLTVAAVASLVPGLRALAADPARVLRAE